MSTDALKCVILDQGGFKKVVRFGLAVLLIGSVQFAVACGDASQTALGTGGIQLTSGGSGTGASGSGAVEPPAGAGGIKNQPTGGIGAAGGTGATGETGPIGGTGATGETGQLTGGSGGTNLNVFDGGRPDGDVTPVTGDDAGTAPPPPPASGTGGGAGTGGGVSGCCPDCICREPNPSDPSVFSKTGPFRQEMYRGATGNIYYPVDADPPFAGVAVCGGFMNTGAEMQAWGPFYASWGIVTVITTTGGGDLPDMRGAKLLASIEELKTENNNPSSPLSGKMSNRYGISGYSMGGGGTTIGCVTDPTLKSGIGLAPWGDVGGMSVPIMFLCGDADFVAGVTTPSPAAGTPSKLVVFSLYSHFNWFGPDDSTGYYALAWQKTYLEGDTRWEPLLSEKLSGVASMQ